jgi:hypothetical protein
LGIEVTHQELRKIISDYAHSLPEDNWVRRDLGDEYTEWKEQILDDQKASEKKSLAPVWGKPKIDGAILSMNFKVNLRITEEENDYESDELRLADIYTDETYTWRAGGFRRRNSSLQKNV